MAIKKLKNIEVVLLGCGNTSVNASDTVADPDATYALDSFKAEKYMTLKDRDNEGTVRYVPFHAVDHIVVNETEETVEDRPSPYDCVPVGGSTAELWASVTEYRMEIKMDEPLPEGAYKSYEDWAEVFANPDAYTVEMVVLPCDSGTKYEIPYEGEMFHFNDTSSEKIYGDVAIVFYEDSKVDINKEMGCAGSGDETTVEVYVTKK